MLYLKDIKYIIVYLYDKIQIKVILLILIMTPQSLYNLHIFFFSSLSPLLNLLQLSSSTVNCIFKFSVPFVNCHSYVCIYSGIYSIQLSLSRSCKLIYYLPFRLCCDLQSHTWSIRSAPNWEEIIYRAIHLNRPKFLKIVFLTKFLYLI